MFIKDKIYSIYITYYLYINILIYIFIHKNICKGKQYLYLLIINRFRNNINYKRI